MPITDDPTAGEFSATPKLEFIDTPEAPNRNVRVIEDFTFTQANNGTVWEAPSGSIVNGASIPRVLWTLVGSPFTGDYVYASIVHDVACDARTRPWRDTHYMFYLACLAGGTRPGRAKLIYLAVRNFGRAGRSRCQPSSWPFTHWSMKATLPWRPVVRRPVTNTRCATSSAPKPTWRPTAMRPPSKPSTCMLPALPNCVAAKAAKQPSSK